MLVEQLHLQVVTVMFQLNAQLQDKHIFMLLNLMVQKHYTKSMEQQQSVMVR